jgi:Anti-sigma factor NepR
VADKHKSDRKEPRKQGKSGAGGTAGFDNWLETKLRTAYSSVLDEPIPEDLIELLSQKLND